MNGNAIVVIVGVILLGVIIWFVYSSSAGAAPGATAVLAPLNGSGISGSVNFVATSDNASTSVIVHLHGLQSGDVYAATINQGACLGPRLFILVGATGDQNGDGTSTTTVPGQPTNEWYVAVHAAASADAPLVACGQVRVTSAPGQYATPAGTNQPGSRQPVQNQQPYQLPNGGGAPPRTPLPTPAASRP
ncbi:MAG TPA: hypothetical protein VIG30_11535 [Ktedonobacterales bacterium]|jgi:hypothetical protein